jgi:hypothetical protein
MDDERAATAASTAADSCTTASAETAPSEASRAEADADAPILCREWQWLLSLALDIDCLGWTRLFSSNHHGRSLHMLAQRTALYRGGVLVVAREASGATQAGFAANGLLAPRDAAQGVYFGNEACCLLRLTPALQVCRAKALGPAGVGGASAAADGAAGLGPSGVARSAAHVGRNFCFLNNKRGVRRGLGFGGTLTCPRLWLDPSLEHGTGSAACKTYSDGMMASEPQFNVDRCACAVAASSRFLCPYRVPTRLPTSWFCASRIQTSPHVHTLPLMFGNKGVGESGAAVVAIEMA